MFTEAAEILADVAPAKTTAVLKAAEMAVREAAAAMDSAERELREGLSALAATEQELTPSAQVRGEVLLQRATDKMTLAAARTTVQLEELSDSPNYQTYRLPDHAHSRIADPEARLFFLLARRGHVANRIAQGLSDAVTEEEKETGSAPSGPTVEEISALFPQVAKVGVRLGPSDPNERRGIKPIDLTPLPPVPENDSGPAFRAFLMAIYERSSIESSINYAKTVTTFIRRGIYNGVTGARDSLGLTDALRFEAFRNAVFDSFNYPPQWINQHYAAFEDIRTAYTETIDDLKLQAKRKGVVDADAFRHDPFYSVLARKAADSALVNILLHFDSFNNSLNALVAFDLAAGISTFFDAALTHGLLREFMPSWVSDRLPTRFNPGDGWVRAALGMAPVPGMGLLNTDLRRVLEGDEKRDRIRKFLDNVARIKRYRWDGDTLRELVERDEWSNLKWDYVVVKTAEEVEIPQEVTDFIDTDLVRQLFDLPPKKQPISFGAFYRQFEKKAKETTRTYGEYLNLYARLLNPATWGDGPMWQLWQQLSVNEDAAFYAGLAGSLTSTGLIAFGSSIGVLTGARTNALLVLVEYLIGFMAAYRSQLIAGMALRAGGVVSREFEDMAFDQVALPMNLLSTRGYAPRTLEEQIARTNPDLFGTLVWRNVARSIIWAANGVSLNRTTMRLTLAYLYEGAMPSMAQAANGAIRHYRGTLPLGRSRVPSFVPNVGWVKYAGASFLAIEGVLFVHGLATVAVTGAGSVPEYIFTQGRSTVASMTLANLGMRFGLYGVLAGVGINLWNNGGDLDGAIGRFGIMVAANLIVPPLAGFALRYYEKKSRAEEAEREREAEAAYEDVVAPNLHSYTTDNGVKFTGGETVKFRRRRALSIPGQAQEPPPPGLVEKSVSAIYGFFDFMANDRRRLVPVIIAGCYILFFTHLFYLVTDSFVSTQREVTRGPKALLTTTEHATLKAHRARRVLARLSHF
jgi:hypothetical protein